MKELTKCELLNVVGGMEAGPGEGLMGVALTFGKLAPMVSAGIVVGASIGSYIPVVGTIIGGTVGGVVGAGVSFIKFWSTGST